MSRVSKWKLEKTKAKVVFRLQFHATHIPQSGWDKLFISFIPADSGKPTAKTTKANVRNGNCKWADPIYETARLLIDSKSKQYDDKLYKIVVAMGSSRASTLGEVTINLADFVDALKPSSIALPLHGCSFGTVLHITVQLLTSKTGFREFEQQRELRERGLQSGVDGYDHSVPRRMSSHSEEVTSDQSNKVSERIKLKADASDLSLVQEDSNVNEEYGDSAIGFDGSSNTSGSLYAEKHDTSSTHDNDSLKSTTSVDLHGLSHYQSPCTVKEDRADHQIPAQGSSGPVRGWGSDNSIGNEMALACDENNQLRGSLESADSSFFNLKVEVSSLQSIADELGAETQKISHQLSAEMSAAEELAKEVSAIKSECVKFKDDIKRIKDLKVSPQICEGETIDNHVDHLVRNMQLQFLNRISLVEGKIREIQKKVSQDGDAKFIYLELEELLDFVMNFELRNCEVTSLPLEIEDVKEIRELSQFKDEPFESGNGLGLDLCLPESVLQDISTCPPMSEVVNPQAAVDAMKGQIVDLVRELDEAKVEKEGLIRKMNHMECYYEALIQELEENQKRLVGELQHLRNEHSTCLYALSVSKTEAESLREDMNQQMLRFAEERHELEAINKELERRATTSETALRRARLNYSIAVDKLQKDLELLSSQVFSMFEANENLIKHALPSPQDSHVDRRLHQNSGGYDVTKSSQFENRNLGLRKRSLGGDVLFEDLKISFLMQEELYQKLQEELIEMYSINLNLDIYSKALEQCLCGADADIRIMKERICELLEEFKLSTASQNHLMVTLQKATDEIHALNEFKSSSISQCSDMALQNQILEEKLASISEENYLLNQKLKYWETTMVEMRSYQSKYEDCLAENAELSLLLKREALEKENLTKESSFLKEKLMILEAESCELVSSKGKLKGNIKFVQDKLVNLLLSYTEQFPLLTNYQNRNLESGDIKDAILHLEEIHRNVCVQNRQLMEDNQNLKSEKADADASLIIVRSEVLTAKQKSNVLVDKLQAELESLAEKLELNSEIEEKFARETKVLLADLTLLEDHMQELMCKNDLLSREISGLNTLEEELERSKFNISKLLHDKQELALFLKEKTDESVRISSENSFLKKSLENLRNELSDEKAYRDELEEKVRDLTVCLQEKTEESAKLSCESSCLKESLKTLRDELNDEKVYKDELEEKVRDLTVCLQEKTEDSSKLSCESICLKEYLETLRGQLHDEKACRDELEGKVQELTVCLQEKTEESSKLSCESICQKESLETLRGQLHDEKACRDELEEKVQDLTVCLQEKTEETATLLCQCSFLKESLETLRDELNHEKAYKDELEEKVRDLTVCLSKNQDKLIAFEQQKDELNHVRELVSDLEMEKSRLAHLLDKQNEVMEQQKDELMHGRELASDLEMEKSRLAHLLDKQNEVMEQQTDELMHGRKHASDLEMEKSRLARLLGKQNEVMERLEKNNSYQVSFESQLLEMHDYSVAADVRLIYVSSQYEALFQELLQKLMLSEECLDDLQKRYNDMEFMWNNSLAGEADWKREKSSLLANLESLRSDLEASRAEKKFLSDSNNVITEQLKECNKKLLMMEARFSTDSSVKASEVELLKNMMTNAEEEINCLMISKEEMEIIFIVLKGKIDEQAASITLLEEYKEELTILRSQLNELSRKLAEQVLKTEEFKNLSIHLKELKDNAEAECVAVREKRESEVPSATMQDSLRIAFIKEQCETKVQELKQQLSISKKHSEEMLLKLQDAIDEIESRKKSEAVSLKKNEELSVRLLALESELTSAILEKREKGNAYDRTKAELECALLSLECCKEEKEKLEASLVEFEAEKTRLATELILVKGRFENLKSSSNFDEDDYIKGSSGNYLPLTLKNDGSVIVVKRDKCVSTPDGKNADSIEGIPILDGEGGDTTEPVKLRMIQSNSKNLHVNTEHLGAQRLRSSIEHLREELEKMKNENIVFDHVDDSRFQDTQSEIMQLHKANDELRSMFPLFDEISSGGNALNRVLALEIELAEALKTKNKSNIQFQSSFLKQHSDDEAVFRSFRDINELIKEMLELKGRHAGVEAELRDMHDRYSELSLRFAEVEGERQKLKMTLKNVRASKKSVSLSPSSSDLVMDHRSL